jgi:peptide/nickel transport system ATP-binding protein
MAELLTVDVSVDYPNKPCALDRIQFSLAEGESLAVVGESGSGKSTLSLAVLGLLGSTRARVRGRICFDGVDLLSLSEKHWRAIRGKGISYVPQSPIASLNPALRLSSQMAEAWRVHGQGSKNAWEPVTLELFERVSLPATSEFLRRFPSQISVGQAQRVLIAMALLHRPRLLISDEPTSAVDPTTRDEITSLLKELQVDFGLANLLITHDLATATALCSRAIVLRNGKLVESGDPAEIFHVPRLQLA